MKAFTSAAALALICLPRIALPCSLVPPSVTAPIAENTGNRPLLISEDLGATLTDDQSNSIAVKVWDPTVEIRGAGARDLLVVKPTVALAPGTYSFGESAFVITSSLAPALPTLESGSLTVFAYKEEGFDGPGCGDSGSSCGSFSGLTVRLQNSEAPAQFQAYLLTVTNENGVAARRLIADEYSNGTTLTELRFYDSFPEFGKLGSERVCATVSIISADGELGTSLDAGCYEPEAGGCVSTRGSKNSMPVLSLLLVGLGLGFIRRRRT
jgi:hypothetical protein